MLSIVIKNYWNRAINIEQKRLNAMPIFRLSNKHILFPDPNYAEDDGLLAIGGDVTDLWVESAYRMGIFPWYSNDREILWWSPNPRFVLFPKELKVTKSLKKFLKKNPYKITFNKNFYDVINNCGDLRKKGKGGTWITKKIIKAYSDLNNRGLAVSAEAWYENKLVGGLYGVNIGKCFYGESMFHTMDNASKVAFVHLVEKLVDLDFKIIDCQVHTDYLESFGARFITRGDFLSIIRKWTIE